MSLNGPIEITDADINEVESLMSLRFDEPRRNIIKNMASIEVNACPGSGKTTLLVAKLAILAKKWPFAHRGICVVSHTNVARNEIENKLGNTDVGKALLQYPHFIGTIQSFVDTYISIPYLKNSGRKIRLIDDDIVCERRWNMIPSRLKYFLSDIKGKDKRICNPLKYHNIYNIKVKETSDTYKALIKTGNESREKGDYTFSEMEQIAIQAVDDNPDIARIVRYRFPFVAVDETQDTKSNQWDVFDKLFPYDSTIIQSFGDANQAIYDFDNDGEEKLQFPFRESPIQLNSSLRFVPEIANLANPVAILKNEIEGCHNPFSRNPLNTIFLFDEGTINSVVKTFAELVLDSFSAEEISTFEKKGVWVVGQIHHGDGDFARDVSSYFKEYKPECTGLQLKLSHLIDFFYLGMRKCKESLNYVDGLDLFAKGIFSLFNRYPKEGFSFHNISRSFSGMLNYCGDAVKEMDLRSLFLNQIKLNSIAKQQWDAFLEQIFRIFSNIIDVDMMRRDVSYIQWYQDDDLALGSEKVNTSCYYKGDSLVKVHFGSIHSVKGMTHLATLVVETFRRTNNIKKILPWLSKAAKKSPAPNESSRMKCLYVAMTRPMGLVCLAIPKASLKSKDLQSLQKLGWNIKDLTCFGSNDA